MSSPGIVTLQALRTLAQQRANFENSQFITDAEWNSYINNSQKELYDLLIGAYGEDYFAASPVTFQTDGVTAFYDLPDGTLYSNAPAFYKLLGVDLILAPGQNGSAITIKPFQFSERNRYTVPNFQSFYGVTNLRYRIFGNQLWLNPIPSAGQSIQLWYLPAPPNMTNDSDTFNAVAGWEEYIVVDSAIKAKDKEQADTSVLMAQKQALLVRIQNMAQNRDAGFPDRVSDTEFSDGMFGPATGMSGFFG